MLRARRAPRTHAPPAGHHLHSIEPLEQRLLLARTLFVDAASTAQSPNGSSWSSAYADLQLALAVAASGDQIHVAQGTYKPTTTTDRTQTFQLKSGVALYGGYAGQSAADPSSRDLSTTASVLSGDIGVAGSASDNSYHVVNGSGADSTAILDGFTITAGRADGGGSFSDGAGMYNVSGRPTVVNCAFQQNLAVGANAPSRGGGIYNEASTPELVGCSFVANQADEGGGIYADPTSLPTLVNCTIAANTATSTGGGLYSSSSNLMVVNSIIWGNSAPTGIQYTGTPTLQYSLVQSAAFHVQPFIRDPSPGADGQWMTADDDLGDLRPQPGSLALDAGDSTAFPPGVLTDVAGKPRFIDAPGQPDTGVGNPPFIDMGAYEAPVLSAVAGGPYTAAEGEEIQLNARGFSAVSTDIWYSWDFDGDGRFDDATGPRPMFSAVGRPLLTPIVVSLRLIDDLGYTDTARATITVVPTIYVDANAPGPRTGSSWATAYADVPTAIAAAIPGQRIHVADGTYKPTSTNDRTKSIQLKTGVWIAGGYAGFGAADPDARDPGAFESILSGDIGVLGNTSDNSIHVVNGSGTDGTAVLDGFTITGGNANGSANNIDDAGGGIYDVDGAATIRDCIIRGNLATHGAGLFTRGIAVTLTANYIINSIFVGNVASATGGAIYDSDVALTLDNCTIAANQALSSASALFSDFNPNTLTAAPRLTNCIIWQNSDPPNTPVVQNTGLPTITYSLVQGSWPDVGIVFADPQFIRAPSAGADGKWATPDDDFGDLRVLLWSPAVDSGDNTAVPTGTQLDLSQNDRFVDIPGTLDRGFGTAPIVDLGAYETVPVLAASAGGPYFAGSGAEIHLDGTGSSPVAGELQYDWEWSGDGKFDDGTGPDPVFSAAGIPLGSILTLSLRVTDASLHSVISSTTLMVVAPIYVDANAPGANNGTSWADAFRSLADALQQASPGRDILVADGTYKPTATTDRTISFHLKSGVRVLGGYAGYGAADPGQRDPAQFPSFLSGDIGVAGNDQDNTYSVVVGSGTDQTAVLDGFTISGGRGGTDAMGGGLYIRSGSPTIIDCAFAGNQGNVGGAIYNVWFGSPILMGCTFTGNNASSGGAIFNVSYSSPMLTDCTFTGNFANNLGGGIESETGSWPVLSNCSFVNNVAAGKGGAVSNASQSTAAISHCTFTGNSAANGGAIANTALGACFVTDCVFTGNSATLGGGIYSLGAPSTFTDCNFNGNMATGTGSGGGICNNTVALTLVRCTFSGNSAGTSGGGLYNTVGQLDLSGCIFSANSASTYGGGIYNASSSGLIAGCQFIGNYTVGPTSGGGGLANLSSEASFVNCLFSGNRTAGSGGGVYLSASSPSLINCSISGNTASVAAGGVFSSVGMSRIVNCVVWGNSAPIAAELQQTSGTLTVTYSDIAGGWSGTANLDVDPLFLRAPSPGPDGQWGSSDDDFGDLRPLAATPVADAGDNSALPSGIDTDLDGNQRFQDIFGAADVGNGTAPLVDLGAYEAVPALAASTGGPYTLVEGHSMNLAGRGASDVTGALQYAWEWSGDGNFDEAAGQAPLFAAVRGNFGDITVQLRVTDVDARPTSVLWRGQVSILHAEDRSERRFADERPGRAARLKKHSGDEHKTLDHGPTADLKGLLPDDIRAQRGAIQTSPPIRWRPVLLPPADTVLRVRPAHSGPIS